MLDESFQETADSSLKDLLHSLTVEGAVNSSGVFTIDVRAALPKLEKFQLPLPHFGVLKVIQSAVASQASFVETNFGSTGLTIVHDGIPPTPDELRDLFSFLLSSHHASSERSLRDLAVGVNTSLARGADWVEVACRQEAGWVRQRWASRDESERLESPNAHGNANVRFTIRNTASQVASGLWKIGKKDIWGMLSGSRETMDQDAQTVFDRCRFAPVTITINGRSIPTNPLGQAVVRRWSSWKSVEHRSANLMEIYLQTDKESPHMMSVPASSKARFRMVAEGHFDGQKFARRTAFQTVTNALEPRRCFAILGIRSSNLVSGEMIVVKDGVELTRLTPPSFPRGVSAVFSAEGLRLDMSQFRLVHSEETQKRIAWMQQMISESSKRALELIAKDAWSVSEREHVDSLIHR